MGDTLDVMIAIGNSEGKLTQSGWSEFIHDVNTAARLLDGEIRGDWYSLPNARWQNAAFCYTIPSSSLEGLRNDLKEIGEDWKQDAIALLVGETEFLTPAGSIVDKEWTGLDPDCRDGKCSACVGCAHGCHSEGNS